METLSSNSAPAHIRKVISLLSLIVIFAAFGCKGRTNSDAGKSVVVPEGNALIAFSEYEHHFGKVAEGEKVAWQFTFENKGTTDLVITSVSTSCGCTVPRYDSKPILPGANGNIEVVFDTSGRDGMQTKTITVKTNAKVPVVLLKISAEVENANQ